MEHALQTSTEKTAESDLRLLEKLNIEFRKQYEKASNNVWDSVTKNGTVIMEKFSSVTLLRQDAIPITEKSLPSEYHELKSIAHIPLTVYLFIENSSTLTDETLKLYWSDLEKLQIPDSFNPEEKQSAEYVVAESRKFLQKEVNQRNSINSTMLIDFCRSLENDLSVLLDAAAIAHLNKLHRIIQDWKNQYGFDPREPSFKVLLIGPRSNRNCNLQTNYFKRLLDDEESRRIIYTEELFQDVPKAKSIFSKWFLDEEISDTFFNDRTRMHRDLLMTERAQLRINELLPS